MEAESENIKNHLTARIENRWNRLEAESSEEFSQFVLWVRGLLEQSKRAKMADFSTHIAKCIKTKSKF